jgi:tRNA/tmRNA/rRNA uracil-C5-methylase (TrmA/RlmC/RlmD family)
MNDTFDVKIDRLEKIAMFDMFPQTYHIESASYWEKD